MKLLNKRLESERGEGNLLVFDRETSDLENGNGDASPF